MKIYEEISLRNFQFWSGGRQSADDFTLEQLDQVEAILEDAYPEGMSDTEINDLFWFEPNTIREWLGMPTEEQENTKAKIDKYNSNFVDWICENGNLDIDTPEDWEEILEQLEDEDLQAEYQEEEGGAIYDE